MNNGIDDRELNGKPDAENLGEDAEEYEKEEYTDSARGDVRDNPHNTRKNHLITLLWACLMAAALIGLDFAGLNRLNEPLDGFMDIAVRELHSGPTYSTEKQYYTIAENKKYEQIEAFEANDTEIFITDYYSHEQGRINFLTEYRLEEMYSEKEIEVTPVMKRLLELVEETETEHWILRTRILRAEGRYFVCVDRNVNLWSPYVLYYYSEGQDQLIHLATFDGKMPVEIRLDAEFHERVGG